MYSPEELNFILTMGGKRHFSNYPEERTTRCGVPLEGDDWQIKTNGFQATLGIAVQISGREDLKEKYDTSLSCKGMDAYCPHCIEALNHSDIDWLQVLEHPWAKKGEGLSYLNDRVFIAQLPEEHVVGWVAVKTKPHEYTYTSGGKSGRGLSTQWHASMPGQRKTSWMPSRTYDTPTVFASVKDAEQVAEHLLSLKREKAVDAQSAELEMHRSEEIYFLCSETDSSRLVGAGNLHFCNFISFTPPLEGVKVEILTKEQLERINFKELKPVLEPLDDIVENES